MKVPVSWLREYVSFDVPPRELGELLSMTGTKLEAVHRIGGLVCSPQIEVVVDRASRRKVFRDRAPLTAGRENVHQAVHDLPHNHRALATAVLPGGISGSTSPHSSSVRSLGYRNLLRS